MHDVQIDESVAERPVFSPAVIGLIVGVLVVGVIFGYMFAQSSQARGLYDNQTEAAKDLAEILKPKVEASQQVVKLVATMDSSKPEYDKTSKLNEIKFVPEAGTITSKTVFLGGGIIYDTTTFMSKASTFKQLIKRHAELTEKDKDELDQLMQGNELLSSDKGFAILFNEKPLVEFASKEKRDPKKFQPKPGTLVSINEFKVDDEGKVAFTHLGSENGGTWPVEGVLPLKKTDLLKTAGTENALARYKRRVDTLKRYALDLNKHVDGVLEPVQEVAQRGGAPVLQLSAPDAPSGASKPAEPAKE